MKIKDFFTGSVLCCKVNLFALSLSLRNRSRLFGGICLQNNI